MIRRSYAYNMRFYLRFQAASNIEFSIGPSYGYQMKDAQWVKQVEKNLKKHYIYGKLESRTLDFTTRANISFTPTLESAILCATLHYDRGLYRLQRVD